MHNELVRTCARVENRPEVATSVLHNVGNVLNSVNVSGSIIADKLRDFPVVQLKEKRRYLRKNRDDLAAFFTADPRGRKLPDFISKLAAHMQNSRRRFCVKPGLMNNIIHIEHIVAMQQNYAKTSGVLEVIEICRAVEVALRMNEGAEKHHRIKMVCELAETPPSFLTDKHKVLQILVNLIRNAQRACTDLPNRDDSQIVTPRRKRGGGGSKRRSLITVWASPRKT